MTVRHFDGVDDYVTLTPLSPNFVGFGTWAMVWRADSVRENGLMSAEASGFQRWGHNPYADGVIYYGYVGFIGADSYSADVWYMSLTTKGSGVTTTRTHRCIMSSDTWAHTDRGTLGDSASGNTAVYLGRHFDSGHRLQGDIACAAIWRGVVLSDAEIESLRPGVADWLALEPDAMWVLNQESTSDPVLDITGNGADQISLVGTSVLTGEDPPDFSLSLTTDTHFYRQGGVWVPTTRKVRQAGAWVDVP